MPNAANVGFRVTDLTQSVSAPVSGINFVLGRSNRGPFNDPSEIINSWPKFVERFGGLSVDSDAPLLCKRLLEKGGSIRFCRIGHYTDISDRETLDADKASYPTILLLEIEGEFDTDNKINLDINAEPINEVTFDIDHDNTVALLRDAILENDNVANVTIGLNGNQKAISLTISPKPGATINITNLVVTGGVTQPNISDDVTTAVVGANGHDLFTLVPKYPGADGNNFKQIISAPSNGAPGYFNLVLQHNIERNIVEEYRNLKIPLEAIAGEKTYLEDVVSQSKYFDVVYHDLTGITEAWELVPHNMELQFTGGTDGTTPTDTDYVGDSAGRNGFHAFDEYDDSYNLAVFDNTSDEVLVAGSAYAAAREDLIFFLEIPYTLRTKSAIISKRNSLNIDSRFTYIFAGGLKTKDPITGQDKEIMAIADVLALENYTSNNYGPWYSFAGINRGNITNALGVVNNFGAAGSFKDLNDLANQQINMVINRDNAIKLWGNFSAQVATTQQSQLSIVRLIIYLKKSLRTPLESFLEEPNDIPTWKRIYYTVLPFLESLVTKRAIYTYDWQGDQFAKSLDDLQINDKTDVSNGKYKILFPIKAIPSLQEIMVNIILAPAGVSFETTAELI